MDKLALSITYPDPLVSQSGTIPYHLARLLMGVTGVGVAGYVALAISTLLGYDITFPRFLLTIALIVMLLICAVIAGVFAYVRKYRPKQAESTLSSELFVRVLDVVSVVLLAATAALVIVLPLLF